MDEFILVHQTCMRKSQLFTVSMRSRYRMEENKALIMALNPGMSVSPRIHVQLLNMHQAKPYLELLNGGNN